MRQHAFVILAVASLAGVVPVAPSSAWEPVCQPEEANSLAGGGCIPSPLQCATGNFNGVWKSATDQRFATCVGFVDAGGHHVVEYVGGDPRGPAAGDEPVCGAIIVDDRLQAGEWLDPNALCGPYGVGSGYGQTGNRYQPARRGAYGAVASSSADASEAGIEVLKRGGNAVDAAVATVFAVGVVEQESCGIGGGGFLLYRGANGVADSLDFRETAPGPPQGNSASHASVGVPGTVAGMSAAARRYGSKPLSELLEPAKKLAKRGIHLTALQEYILRHLGASKLNAEGRKQYGVTEPPAPIRRVPPPYPVGKPLPQTDMADTLGAIATGGADVFYRNSEDPSAPSIADQILDEMEPHGWTADDLRNYQPVWREPLRTTYEAGNGEVYEMLAVPPPASGVTVFEMLNIIEPFALSPAPDSSFRHSSAGHLHLLAETEKLALADQQAYLADPDFEPVPAQELISKAYATKRRSHIDENAKKHGPGAIEGYEARPPATADGSEGTSTHHISVVDAAGNAVTVTCTIESGYGSGIVVSGTGIVLNSELDDFDACTNDCVNKRKPGKRPRSNMTPIIATRDGVPRIVVGSEGGEFIPIAVTLAISNVIDFSMEPGQALDVLRLHSTAATSLPDAETEKPCGDAAVCELILEYHRVPHGEYKELQKRGHTIVRDKWSAPVYGFPNSASATMVGIDRDRNRFATADPRGDRGARVLNKRPQGRSR